MSVEHPRSVILIAIDIDPAINASEIQIRHPAFRNVDLGAMQVMPFDEAVRLSTSKNFEMHDTLLELSDFVRRNRGN